MPRLTDRPPLRDRLADTPWYAAGGGVLCALVVLLLANVTRLATALDDAAWDRVATALADTPLPPELLVVPAPTRVPDWQLAAAALRLDSAGAAVVALAADLSHAVPPGGAMPLLVEHPHVLLPFVVTGRDDSGDARGGDPWFVTDSTARVLRAAGRMPAAELVRDADGVVRRATMAGACPGTLAWRVAASVRALPACTAAWPTLLRDVPTMLLRFSRADTGWFGARALPIDSVLAMPRSALGPRVRGHMVILGVDDGSTVPTAVGAMAPLAVLAHEVGDAADGHAPIMDAEWPGALLWIVTWLILGAVAASLLSMRLTVTAAAAGVVLQLLASLWLVDMQDVSLPLGQSLLAMLAAMIGAELLALRQARRQQRLTTMLFSRFVTPALADEAWAQRHVYLEGGRPAPRQVPVTVLFVDLRGFTRFSESADPAQVMALITEVTAACAADIAACGGLVDDFAGDGIKADFGVPVPRTDPLQVRADAAAAVQCAARLSQTIAALLPPELGTAGVQARIGIHSGMALAGTVGGGTRLKYTVVGDVVNVAARLQGLELPARDGARCTIVLSADTLALLDTPPAVEDLGPVPLSGRAQPVPAWRMLSTSRTSS